MHLNNCNICANGIIYYKTYYKNLFNINKSRGISMEALKKKILTDGTAMGTDIVKVDSFINHQIDVAFMNEIGKEFARIFSDVEVTKIVTI